MATVTIDALPRRLVSTASTAQMGSSASRPSASGSAASSAARPRGVWLDKEEGLSSGLGGFGTYGGSVTAFMKPESEKKATAGLGVGPGPLPCEEAGSQAALQAAQAELMANAAMSGKLPSPRRPGGAEHGDAQQAQLKAALSGQAPLPATPHPTHPARRVTDGRPLHGDKRHKQPHSHPLDHWHAHGSGNHGHSHSDDRSGGEAHAGVNTRIAPSSLPRKAAGAASRAITRGADGVTAASTAAAKAAGKQSPFASPPLSFQEKQQHLLQEKQQAAQRGESSSGSTAVVNTAAREQEAEDYYRSVPRTEISKEEMWKRIQKANADRIEREGTALPADDVDYIQMEEDIKEHDLLHYRIGEIAYPDTQMRRDYYAMWQLAMALNKARWTMLEVQSQRGVKSTGAGMKLLFWKESVNSIMDKRSMISGQFADSHPILRPFAAAVERNPQMTKAFVRGFTSARLKVIQQPGNVKQLYDHFDKYYGYFFNSLLEVTQIKDENAEHMMLHIGRATGLTNHCVMFWKKYARIGFTMLPADLCADNHVNLALLKNISLASKDRAVKKVLYDVMCLAKDEMLHAQKLASNVDPRAWPIAMECLYANYYLGFLQRREFNVSAMFADYNIENAGFTWYRLKKRWEWERYQSMERLVDEAAPLPFIGTSISHRGSKYKMASGMGQQGGSSSSASTPPPN